MGAEFHLCSHTQSRTYLYLYLSSMNIVRSAHSAMDVLATVRSADCGVLQVGLTVLQYLVWVVQACLANSQLSGSAAAAGPAEAVLARKLLELVRAVGAQEAAGGEAWRAEEEGSFHKLCLKILQSLVHA